MIANVTNWLSEELSVGKRVIQSASIFGSLAAGVSSPHDCDVLIVVNADPDSEEWHAFRLSISGIRGSFLKKFGIPLSVMLMSVAESNSQQGFIESLAPIIEIHIQ